MGRSYSSKERSEAPSLLGRGTSSEQIVGGNENVVDGASKLEKMKFAQCD